MRDAILIIMNVNVEWSLIDMQQFNTMFEHFSFLFRLLRLAMHFAFSFFPSRSGFVSACQRQQHSDAVQEQAGMNRRKKK